MIAERIIGEGKALKEGKKAAEMNSSQSGNTNSGREQPSSQQLDAGGSRRTKH